ncbi:olfactory receptor 5A2-like [Cavia porcellus]|uniref:olfactory receptor 5A2-like n=1 Tax=Cavia porcellus TaxID=10141 RepID=UPI000661D572|nr:olfactory receptor 5A2-like [Cavia porcellus]
MMNDTTVTEFILQGFSDELEMRIMSAVLVLFIYLFALLGNASVIAAVTRDSHLHTSMYFFLKNLSFLDMCYPSVTVPKVLASSLAGSNVNSFWEWMAELFLFVTLCALECFLLTSMACNRCLAIHRPLLYGIMSRKLCYELVVAAWLSGVLYDIFHTINTFSLPFCGPNIINYFFCDSSPIMRLSCRDACAIEEVRFVVVGCVILGVCALTILPYVLIIANVMQIHSAGGCQKAFSTCSSHLVWVILFYIAGSFAYLTPTAQYSPTEEGPSSHPA